MKKAIAFKWATALESGEYKQGREALRKGKSYCCLGVLCDLSKQGVWNKTTYAGSNTWEYRSKLDRSEAELPEDVEKWAGLKSQSGRVTIGEVTSLANMNDSKLFDFKMIAAFIRKNYKVL